MNVLGGDLTNWKKLLVGISYWNDNKNIINQLLFEEDNDSFLNYVHI